MRSLHHNRIPIRAPEPLYQSQQYQNPRIERFTNS